MSVDSVGAIGLAIGMVAVASAAIPDEDGTIQACYANNNGDLRVVDGAACRTSETALTWSQAGPQGPVGATGPQGSQGIQGEPGLPASNHIYVSDTSVNDHLSDGVYTVGLTLPAGKYAVWLSAEIYYDNSSGFNSQCAFWVNDPATPDDDTDIFVPSVGDGFLFDGKDDEQGQLKMMATVTLAADNQQILAFCASTSDDDRRFVVSQMFAMKVDAIN
jgi:hypothetical protein